MENLVEACSCAVVGEELCAFSAEGLLGRRRTGRDSSSVGDRFVVVEDQRKVWYPAFHTASCCRAFDRKLR